VTRNDDERIADILEAGATLTTIVAGGETLWRNDEIRRLAAERLLEIIGESARAMSDEARAQYPHVAWSEIVGLRTILAHHYHRVDADQVWVIASREVPTLVAALQAG
jgi:uncharacterized protein with HEPN domain